MSATGRQSLFPKKERFGIAGKGYILMGYIVNGIEVIIEGLQWYIKFVTPLPNRL